jgi:hypothetical protein
MTPNPYADPSPWITPPCPVAERHLELLDLAETHRPRWEHRATKVNDRAVRGVIDRAGRRWIAAHRKAQRAAASA